MKINYIKRIRKNIISIKEGNSSWKNLEGKRASLIILQILSWGITFFYGYNIFSNSFNIIYYIYSSPVAMSLARRPLCCSSVLDVLLKACTCEHLMWLTLTLYLWGTWSITSLTSMGTDIPTMLVPTLTRARKENKKHYKKQQRRIKPKRQRFGKTCFP